MLHCWLCSFEVLDFNSRATPPVKKSILMAIRITCLACRQLRGFCFHTRLDGSEGMWRHQCFAQGLFNLLLEHKENSPPPFFFKGNTWKCSSYYNKVLKLIYYQVDSFHTVRAKRASCVKEQKKKKCWSCVSSWDKRNTFVFPQCLSRTVCSSGPHFFIQLFLPDHPEVETSQWAQREHHSLPGLLPAPAWSQRALQVWLLSERWATQLFLHSLLT